MTFQDLVHHPQERDVHLFGQIHSNVHDLHNHKFTKRTQGYFTRERMPLGLQHLIQIDAQ